MARVAVQIEWPAGLTSLPPGALAHVTVEDATRADASSVVLGETVLTDLDPTTATVAEVEVPGVDAGSVVIARVHVVATPRGTRDVELGDLVSTQSHPVLTRGHGDSVVVPLHQVGS